MRSSRITKYNYKPVKNLKAPAIAARNNTLFKRLGRWFAANNNLVPAHPTLYSYSNDKGIIKTNAARNHQHIGVLIVSIITIGVAVSFPLDRSIASASLDSLQGFFDNSELQEQMSRLQLRSLQATVNELNAIEEPVNNAVVLYTDNIVQASRHTTNSATSATASISNSPSVRDKQTPAPKATQATSMSVKYVAPVQSNHEAVRTTFDSTSKQSLDSERRLLINVKSGDNLSRLFKQHQLNIGDLHRILKLGTQVNALKKLNIGQQIFVQADTDGNLLSLQLELANSDKILHIEFSDAEQQFIIATHSKALGESLQARTELIALKVPASGKLQQIAQRLELPEQVSSQLARIFKEILDLEQQDLIAGDEIRVLFEAYFYREEVIQLKHILAADIQHRQKSYQVVRYTDADNQSNYYTPQGQSLLPSFLSAPVKEARITSHFSHSRRHPVLKVVRPHLGVDYGAAWGAPIYATADGVISHKGWRGGYGRTLIIEHQQNHETLYAHLSKYADVAAGDSVTQGQVIGYVGNSGLTSSAHLHYEVRVNGEHRDPLSIQLPQGRTTQLAKNADFIKKSHALLAQLRTNTQLAQAARAQTPPFTEVTP